MALRNARILKELARLQESELNGIFLQNSESGIDTIKVDIIGPSGSRFEGITNSLELKLSDAFPFEPPSARFTSPVRHPNVDEISGRICLDLLKMPPDGSWRPNISLSTVLVSIQVLLGSPNLNDVVRPELIAEFSSECTPLEGKENSLSLTTSESSYYEKKRSIGLSMSFIRKKAKFTIENKDEPCD